MSKKSNGQNYKKDSKTRSRRARVVTRLESQLKSGTKPGKELNKKNPPDVALTQFDINRINKEVEILKARI